MLKVSPTYAPLLNTWVVAGLVAEDDTNAREASFGVLAMAKP